MERMGTCASLFQSALLNPCVTGGQRHRGWYQQQGTTEVTIVSQEGISPEPIVEPDVTSGAKTPGFR
ncbi:hypothetical protein DUI87_24996 [Hirundo rustica rustica]|uniref:Uncharacterized protein n=1 Tax=Hirundo rustica rustica TaxID=333673 RepID=A0A3M0JC83_HIRRU|nr:hypothetical protein DUI87_24996 [Hirundo rustica rustica]